MVQRQDFTKPVPVILMFVALIGWIFAIYLLTARANLEEELAQQTQAVGTLDTLRVEVATLSSETARLSNERDIARTGAAEQVQLLRGLEQQIAVAEDDLTRNQTELNAVQQQVAPLRAEIVAFDTARTDTELRLAEVTEELASVGQRLTEARASEAEIQQQLLVMTDETARLTADSADAEARVQEARGAEADLQTRLVAETETFERMTSERDALARELEDLTLRRDVLAAENIAASEQRQSLQSVVTQLADDLATRGQQLAEIEQRISDAQLAEVTPPQSDVTMAPGSYTVGPLVLTLGADGRFGLRNDARGQEVIGTFTATQGRLTLTEPEGDVGATPFPIICSMVETAEGLILEGAGDESCAMSGLAIEAQE